MTLYHDKIRFILGIQEETHMINLKHTHTIVCKCPAVEGADLFTIVRPECLRQQWGVSFEGRASLRHCGCSISTDWTIKLSQQSSYCHYQACSTSYRTICIASSTRSILCKNCFSISQQA